MFNKAQKVITSCTTKAQLLIALRYAEIARKRERITTIQGMKLLDTAISKRKGLK